MKEFNLISRIKSGITLNDKSLIKGIGDDCAVIQESNRRLLVTTDAFSEGTHFKRKYFTPSQAGAKAAAVNISDICAMGGIPRYMFVTLGLPKKDSGAYAESLMSGMIKYAENYGVVLAGGDTIRSEKIFISVTMIGEADNGFLSRSGARPGDRIFVTGCLGDAKAGFEILEKKGNKKLKDYEVLPVKKFIAPQPKLAEGRLLLMSKCVSSCMDISDGIISDISRICEESRAGAEINAGLLPVSPSLKTAARMRKKQAADYALYGGEDYELLFTVPENKLKKFAGFMSDYGLTFFETGRITAKKGVRVIRGGRTVKESFSKAWKHF